MRTFIAVDLPDALRAALVEVQAGLPGRHVADENLHLTLAFLGNAEETVLEEIHEALSTLSLAAPVLRVTGLDVAGGRLPNLCFATVERNEALTAVQKAVLRACRAAGVALPRERFRPHVTLSRFGRDIGPREAQQLAQHLGVLRLPPAMADGFSLYRSDLHPDGPVYTALAQYDFD